ncbi:Rit1 N-terminal domain-containing protein [Elsinoe australis]|uniref:Rit1 N-terminal domain-containing protein n=1 Tax=Elsinoe australis TaxID=40998 RepID=A0A4U7BAI5_9PEZI|nr:Rit1 N-terminal domain-containing protein [Elsinoe australis]
MPDALSKTVPIWACVWNRLLFSDDRAACKLSTPSEVIGESEHAQIELRIDGFVRDLQALNLDLEPLKKSLKKPLQPIWATQSSELRDEDISPACYPLVLCTASGRDAGQDVIGYNYVQGAADDAEAWALGLSPVLFWKCKSLLLQSPEEGLAEMIPTIVAEGARAEGVSRLVLIKPTSRLFIGTNNCCANASDEFGAIISCESQITENEEPDGMSEAMPKRLRLHCQAGKLGSRALRHSLHEVLPLVDEVVSKSEESKILVTCPTGKDHSIGVALAITCLYATEDGNLLPRSVTQTTLNKDFIKKRLSWTVASIPEANPSRATLQSVNAFLLG